MEENGFEVLRIAVCWRTQHDRDDPKEPIIDIARSSYRSLRVYRDNSAWGTHLADYYITGAVADTPELQGELLARIAVAAPDVILLEHPWTWPLVKALPAIRSGALPIIYSSHNVEALLKRQMLHDAGVAVPEDVLNAVEALERDLVTSSWATVVCTNADASVFRSWKAVRVIVANNGTQRKRRGHLRGVLPEPLLPEHHFALYVGSNYLPNIGGFFNMLAPSLPRLRPLERIVIAGSMCDAIDAKIAASSLRHYRGGRLVSLGYVSDLVLDSLIANAWTILLPIEYGGGSNVKTAEALWAGRHVVATSVAFRGFAAHRTHSLVTLADTAELFEAAIRRAFASPVPTLVDMDGPQEVLWEATLQPLIRLLRSMGA